MAFIQNVTLDILKGKTTSTVSVSFTACFTSCELKAGFYFSDCVDLFGADSGPDQYLLPMGRTNCYQPKERCITRSYKRTVKNSILDEDPKWLGIFNRRDEVYARACIKPVVPRGECRNSPIEFDYFEV